MWGPPGVGKKCMAHLTLRELNIPYTNLDELVKLGLGDAIAGAMHVIDARPRGTLLIDGADVLATHLVKLCTLCHEHPECRVVVTCNNIYAKELRPLKRLSAAKTCTVVRTYPLRDAEIAKLLRSRGVHAAKDQRRGIEVSRGDARQAIAFAEHGAQARDQCVSIFDACRHLTNFDAPLSSRLEKARCFGDAFFLADMVTANYPKWAGESRDPSIWDHMGTIAENLSCADALRFRSRRAASEIVLRGAGRFADEAPSTNCRSKDFPTYLYDQSIDMTHLCEIVGRMPPTDALAAASILNARLDGGVPDMALLRKIDGASEEAQAALHGAIERRFQRR